LRTGRPREFDVDQALEGALKVFWRKGYEGSTLPDLTKAMGINRPSLYAAFGSKEKLFRKVLDRYSCGPAGYISKALEAPTARAVVNELLRGTIELVTDRRNPRGCLIVHGALVCGEAAESIRRELVSRRLATEAAIRKRLQRGIVESDLPADSRAADMARYVVAVMQGIAVQAAGGANRAQLRRVAAMALRAWPTGSANRRRRRETYTTC
jgi:AcrR family transcriptional regulator